MHFPNAYLCAAEQLRTTKVVVQTSTSESVVSHVAQQPVRLTFVINLVAQPGVR